MNHLAEPAKWLGETLGFWIQTLILGISAVAAVWIIRASSKQEKRRATVDLVLDQLHDLGFHHARAVLNKMREAGDTNLSRFASQPDSQEYKHILMVLNTHEFTASGIRQGAFDEKIYKTMRFSTIANDWKSLCAFIFDFRIIHDKKETLFQDFQWLSDRWQKKPLKADR